MDDQLLPADAALLQVEQYLREVWNSWNYLTTVILVVFGFVVLLPWLLQRDPDTHPLLLSRQSTPSPVRLPGESSVYRSQDIPYGFDYITGLNLKAPGAPSWSAGRNGTLGDIWKQACSGVKNQDGSTSRNGSSILTVHGKEDIVFHTLDEVTQSIVIIGKYFTQRKAKRIAIYLPNSIEFLTTFFAASFYGQSLIFLPFNLPHAVLITLLRNAKPDLLVAAAGSVPLQEANKNVSSLKQIIWVTDEGSRHMDWGAVPSEIGGSVGISVWQDIVDDRASAQSGDTSSLPEPEGSLDLVFFTAQGSDTNYEMTTYSSKSVIAAVGAQLASVPRPSQRFGPSDLFLPADALSSSYVLVLTLAALYSNASIALNSVAVTGVKFQLATRLIKPTIVVASAETMSQLHELGVAASKGLLPRISIWSQTRSLATGTKPEPSFLNGFSNPFRSDSKPGKLRLIYTYERAGSPSCPPLSSVELSDLRIFTGARIMYALTGSKVAGAVAQTKFYDYRVVPSQGTECCHFGAPLGCVDVKLVDTSTHESVEGKNPEGEITVAGPAVAGGSAKLGVNGTFRSDHTLAYVY